MSTSFEPLVLYGRVLDTNDPDHLGRVQVQLAGFEATEDLPWLRMLHPYASKAFGSFVLPEKDDEVASGTTPPGCWC